MKDLQFNLPEFGKAVGSSKWVAEKLDEISKSFTNGKTKSTGTPALFYEWETAGGKKNTYIFCTAICQDNDFEYSFLERSDRVLSTHAIDHEQQWGLFNYLTPKAKDIVENFIEKVSEEWIKKLEEL